MADPAVFREVAPFKEVAPKVFREVAPLAFEPGSEIGANRGAGSLEPPTFGEKLDSRLEDTLAGPFGLSRESEAKLSEIGIYPQEDDGPVMSAVRQFNKGLIGGSARIIDSVFTGVVAVTEIAATTVGEIAEELGVDPGDARRLERDMFGIFTGMGTMGATFGAPTRVPKKGKVKKERTLRREDAPPVVVDTAETLAEAAKAQAREAVAKSGMPPEGQAAVLERLDRAIDAAGAQVLDKVPRAGNIRLDKLDTTEGVKKFIQETAARHDDFIGGRRGVIKDEELFKLADELDMKPEDLIRRGVGEAFNAEEITRARQIFVESAESAFELSRKAVGGSDAEIIAAAVAVQRHAMIQESVMGAAAEAGRTLRALQLRVGSKEAELRDILESMGGRAKVEDIIHRIGTSNRPQEVHRLAREAFAAKSKDMVVEAWINGLLSGPQTHAVNVLSNTLTQMFAIPEHYLAAGFGKLRGDGDKVLFRDVNARAFGMVEGMKDGLFAAGRAFRTEEASDFLNKIDVNNPQAIPSVTFRKGKAGKSVSILGNEVALPLTGEIKIGGKQIRIPGRMLLAGDEFFKTIAYRAKVNELAMRQAIKEGGTREQIAARIQELKTNPPKDIKLAAVDEGQYLTFTNQLGDTGQSLVRAANKHIVLKFFTPFIRTPTNIVKFAGHRTPAAPLMPSFRKEIKAGGSRRDVALARMTMGSAVMATTAYLAAQGLVTGGGPSPASGLRGAWLQQNQPYSIKVGDRWVAYNRVEPLGILLGLSADFTEISGEVGEKEAGEIGAALVMSVARNITSKTFLEGLSGLVEAVSDPERNAERMIQKFAGTLIPTGVAQVQRVQDPTLRDVRSAIDQIRSRIPGYAQDLPARRNLWGEPIQLAPGIGPDIISPLYSRRIEPDAVEQEILRLEVPVRPPVRRIGKVELTPQEYARYVEDAGRPAKVALDRLVASPGWAGLPDEGKIKVIKDVLRQTRAIARRQLAANLLISQRRQSTGGENERPRLTPEEMQSLLNVIK